MQTNPARQSSLNTVPESKEHSLSSHMNSHYQLKVYFPEAKTSSPKSKIKIEDPKPKTKPNPFQNGHEYDVLSGQNSRNRKDEAEL